MTTVLVVGFLLAHGLVHLAVWLPHPEPEPAKPPPFMPDHSALLTAVRVPAPTTRRVSEVLAIATAAVMVIAALGVALGQEWAIGAAVLGATLGLVLKLVFFDPWLLVGITLDLLVLSLALADWPVPLV